MNQKITPEQLERFYKGQCSPQEHMQILEWIKSFGDKEEVNIFMKNHWERVKTDHTISEPDFDLIYQRIGDDIWEKNTSRRINLYKQLLKIAAVFIGCLLIAGSGYYIWRWQQTAMYTTGNGEQLNITLPDQSTLILNANSTVRYNKSWKATEKREVWLEGEGFFSVVHTTTHQPFLVHTSKECFIEVLGTTFNVFNRKSGTRIVLNSGKIKLNLTSENAQAKTQLVMNPGEMVEFKDDPAHYSKQLVNPTIYSAWKTHTWILKNESLQAIASRIEETYGLKVIIASTRNTGNVTGVIPTNNLDVLLEALSTTLKVNIIKEKDSIIIQ